VPLQGVTAAGRGTMPTLYLAADFALFGLWVYGLSRLAGLARELEGLRGELARMAAVRERLRVARDVHDLLGLGLSAVALKADLADALIGRDDARAAAEMEEMGRICATARADIRLVTGDRQLLSLAGELAAAKQILASAGIEVRAGMPSGPLPAAADQVLAPVLREAVTNILRHTAATAGSIKLSTVGGWLRLQVSNDGVAAGPGTSAPTASGAGHGLANLNARLQAAGGRLTIRQAGARFCLAAEIPLSRARLEPAGLAGPRRHLLAAGCRAGQPGVDDPFPPGHGADGANEVPGGAVLEQVAGHSGAQRGR